MARYVLSDLHGIKALYDKIKNFLNPEDIVYYLGDAGDRGPDSWELIKTIASDNQFVYLKGNHEDMLQNAIDDEGWHSGALNLLASNGGLETYNDWVKDGSHQGWKSFFKKLPTYIKLENKNGYTIHLSHAGFTPGYFSNAPEVPCDEDLMWDRSHLYDGWSEEEYPKDIVIHGHTPICYMKINKNKLSNWVPDGAFWYCGNHKVNIDCASFYTGTTVLLDIDTFDEHIFSIENFKKEE